jgi:hypothetical protein
MGNLIQDFLHAQMSEISQLLITSKNMKSYAFIFFENSYNNPCPIYISSIYSFHQLDEIFAYSHSHVHSMKDKTYITL